MQLSKWEKQAQKAVNTLVELKVKEMIDIFDSPDIIPTWHKISSNEECYLSMLWGRIYLRSYETVIAYYSISEHTIYEFLRLRYHWTKASQRHIDIFLQIIRVVYGSPKYIGYLNIK